MPYFLGYRSYSFKDKETQEDVSGVTAWFADDDASNGVGFIPWKASYSHSNFEAIFGKPSALADKVLHPVEVKCNRWGKPTQVVFVEPAE